MKLPDFHKADRWISKILSYPGIDEEVLAQKKINWLASIAVTLMISILTLTYHLIFPQLRLLIYYGLILTIIYSQGIIYPLIFKYIGVWRVFIDQILVVIITFIFILKLGGIADSGGLIFVGLAQVFFSLNFRKKIHSLIIFVVYLVTIILSGFLHPYLTVPPEMNSTVNISLFVFNLLWISVFAMVFILNFISQQIRLKQHETIRLKELDEFKSRLYTNITHEFRTPLTIITGMTELMKNDPEKYLGEGCNKINNNAAILLNLVNQMLDLSKLEAGAMPVKMIRADINLFIRHIVELFQSVADKKKIKLDFDQSDQQLIIDYDPEKLMQIISNLISNALKFTQYCGRINVSTSVSSGNKFEILVGDNGPGIAEAHLPYIFDRFYRVGEGGKHVFPGSGLGLALTREIVKLLDGTITVESVFGEGTEFLVSLPVTCNAPIEEVTYPRLINDTIVTHSNSNEKNTLLPSTDSNKDNSKPLLLIVEDNDDVVQYLITVLGKEYEVMVAEDGHEGLLKAYQYVPDIVLSDIMMPRMDGIEMLEKVKCDIRTSHIPVVLLTAKADIVSRLEGLERGADAYIAKPFSKEELLVQLRSLVEFRKKLRDRYSAIGNLRLSEEKNFHYEDAFMNKVRDKMTCNLSDEMFDIHKLCSEMAMSRTQLYRKFRSLTDKTPNDYFLTLRLHKAMELLSSSEISVSEAAYGTGFKNLSHFSRAFTHEFGINPSEVHK